MVMTTIETAQGPRIAAAQGTIRTANLLGSVSRKAGGLFESVRGLVKSLERTGMEVRVLGLEDEFTAADGPAWAPVPVRTFALSGPQRFGFSAELARELNEFRPDITHTHGIWMYLSVATRSYSRRHRRRYVVSAHGMLDPWALDHSRWKKLAAYLLYERQHLRGADCLRALCEAEARAMRGLGLKNPIAIIPNGVLLTDEVQSPECKVQSPESKIQSRESHSPSLRSWVQRGEGGVGAQGSGIRSRRKEEFEGRKVLLYLGRVHAKKGLLNLVKAWAGVQGGCLSSSAARRTDWVLAIAGWDENGHEAQLKRLCDELGLAWVELSHPDDTWSGPAAANIEASGSQVFFVGPQFGVGKSCWYEGCSAVVLPSYSEGLPMVVLEAWAHGKPVLMTPECNLPEGFAAGAALRIGTSVAETGRGLQTLFEMSPGELEKMGARGRALAGGRFGWTRIAAQMREVYEWVLGGGAKPETVR